MASLISNTLLPSESDDEADDIYLPFRNIELTYASSLRVPTTASLGRYEAIFSFIYRSERKMGPGEDACHTPHYRDCLALYHRF